MRPEERYWLKMSVTIGLVVLTLLVLIVLGLGRDIEHIFASVVDFLD